MRSISLGIFKYAFFLTLLAFAPVLRGEELDAGKALLQSGTMSSVSNVTDRSYVLQTGDMVNIKIYPEDEYIKGIQMEVSTEGNITLPLVGKIKIAGKTVAQAEKEIVEILDRDYLVNPEVVIQVAQHRKQTFVVLGQVKKPGTYDLPAGSTSLTLLQGISMAGGFTDIANIKKIKIVRLNTGGGGNQVIQANADAIIGGNDPDPPLKQGDVVNVSESLF